VDTRVRLCGGLAVEVDGVRVDDRLRSRQARVLFALLVLERRRTLSRQALADALWPGTAPRSQDGSIRALLTGVRRVFGPESIAGRDSVQLVLPDGATVDVEQVSAALADAEAALARGDHDAACVAARTAAALSSDELLAGLSAPWIDDRRAELEELSLRALEVEGLAALAAGRPQVAERAARRLVERAPFREPAYELLMQALAAQGNVAEATLAYDRLRTLLREALGTSPSPPVVALHERLLAGEPVAAERSGPLPAVLARAAARPFVARDAELARLRTAWEFARAGEGRVVVVAGEPGIGKTTLVARAAQEASARGAAVLLGRCHPEALVPYEPFVELLRQLPPAVLQPDAGVLARIVPELGRGEAVPDDPRARHVLFDAVERALAAAAPALLVLDDLHWAEPPTLLLVRHVARAAERRAVLILLTYRTTEVPGTAQVTRSLVDLERELDLERIGLTGLADEAVTAMVGALEGVPSSRPLGLRLRRDTAGNPLFVGQLLRHLDETGALAQRDGELSLAPRDAPIGVPDTAKQLVAARLAALDDHTAEVLRTAAVIGRAFPAELLEAVDGGAVHDALDTGTAAGLLEEQGDGRWAFVHALVREAIYDGTGGGRRATLHRRVAEALAGRPGAEPAELAHHYLAAGDRAHGIEYSLASARRALAQLAYEDAAAHYERALGALDASDRARRCELLLALADAHARAGRIDASRPAYREAAELADALGLPRQLARAAIGYSGRVIFEVSRDDPDLVPMLERALGALGDGDDVLRAQLLARLGGGPLRGLADHERRDAITAEAVAIARRLDDPITLGYALLGSILAHHTPGNSRAQLDEVTELIAIAEGAGDLERAAEAYENRACLRIDVGDVAGADADIEAIARVTAELRQPAQDWILGYMLGNRAVLDGRLDEAERVIDAAVAAGRAAHLPFNTRVTHGMQHFVTRRLQGRSAEVEPLLRELAGAYGASYALCRCAHLLVLADLGRAKEADGVLDVLAGDGFAALHQDETWLGAVALVAEAAAIRGHAGHAAVLYAQLSPYADRVAISKPEISLGAVERYLGLVAATCGRTEEADAHLRAAAEYNERIGARPWLALSLYDRALLLGDRALADRAAAELRALGMVAWAAKCSST
jgi:DNA-binding SARP family transcriptional activator